MAPRKRSPWCRADMIPGVVLAGVIALGLVAVVIHHEPSRHGVREVLTDAAARRAVTDAHVKTPLIQRWASWQREAAWLVLGDLGPSVLRGAGEWLFLAEELRVNPARETVARQRADAAIALARRLAQQQVVLVVAVVPDKSRVAHASLGSLRRPPAFAARVQDWVARLEAAGVTALDLTQVLASAPDQTFLRTDTHWTAAGAEAAAEEIARKVRQTGVVPGAAITSTHTVLPEAPLWGDLIKLAGLDGLPEFLRPASDRVRRAEIRNQSTSDDLFGDEGLPTAALLGTSFSRRSNFLPALERALGEKVADYSMDGGDFSGSVRRFQASDTLRSATPRVLIWELPERTLEMAPTSEEYDWLAQATGEASPFQ